MKRIVAVLFLGYLFVLSCTNSTEPRKVIQKKKRVEEVEQSIIPSFLINPPNGRTGGKDTLVVVNHYNSAIYWDLKYATTDNFMHRVLYDTLQAPYLQNDIAKRLALCQQALSEIDTSLHLLVYDALRPLSVQWEMWKALDTIPFAERVKFVSNPKNGSVHNYGAAVDITICSSNKKPLDMGANYDDMRKIAYPNLESVYIANGQLTSNHIKNRQLLRKVMRSQRFSNIPSEWWHFNAYSRSVVKGKYEVVGSELSN